MKKILSFDVGIKNLAYCLLCSDNKSILDWGILNISIDPVCDHKSCDKSASKCDKDGFKLCTVHSKLKMYSDKKLKNIKKIDNHMFHMGKQIIKKLDEKGNFSEVDIVCIENQPALKNPTMKSVQMIIYSYFLMKSKINDIQMINARNKLKVYDGPKIECNIKETYKKNKFLAIKYCDYMIRDNKEIDKKYHDLYDSSKKKDDLSDSYLQGIYYIDKLKY